MSNCIIDTNPINNGYTAFIYNSKIKNIILKQTFIVKPEKLPEIEFIDFIKKDKNYVPLSNFKNESLNDLILPFIPYGKYTLCNKGKFKYYVIETLKLDGNVFDLIGKINEDEVHKMLDIVYKGLIYLKEQNKYNSDLSFVNIFYRKQKEYEYVIGDNSFIDKPNNVFNNRIKNVEYDAIIYYILKFMKFNDVILKIKDKELNEYFKDKYERRLKQAEEYYLNKKPNHLIEFTAQNKLMYIIRNEHPEILYDIISDIDKDLLDKIKKFKEYIHSYDLNKFENL